MTKQTISFADANPYSTANFSLPRYWQAHFEPTMSAWSIDQINGFFHFALQLDTAQGVNLILQLCSGSSQGRTDSPISITVNGQTLVASFDGGIDFFYDMVWSIPANMLHAGQNDVVVTLVGGSTKVYVKYAIVDIFTVMDDEVSWMKGLSDQVNLSDINIPGTHDTAAINTTISTPYACHNTTVTEQLNGGIRLLDVRLRVDSDSNNNLFFMTCHGDLGSGYAVNEYQSFLSLLTECSTFLASNPSETVLMSLKVDDWNGRTGGDPAVLNALSAVLVNYQVVANANLPNLGNARGKIVLLNRITGDLRFGPPISWNDATTGSWADVSPNRAFAVYVQDAYKNLPTFGSESYKTNLVTQAFQQKTDGSVVWNFASATYFGVLGIYVMDQILAYFGQSAGASRPARFGWLMMDYEFEQYQTDVYGSLDLTHFIIASNFSWSKYASTFKIVGHDEL